MSPFVVENLVRKTLRNFNLFPLVVVGSGGGGGEKRLMVARNVMQILQQAARKS